MRFPHSFTLKATSRSANLRLSSHQQTGRPIRRPTRATIFNRPLPTHHFLWTDRALHPWPEEFDRISICPYFYPAWLGASMMRTNKPLAGRVNLTKYVKVGGHASETWRFCPVVRTGNGRIRPDYVLIDGKPPVPQRRRLLHRVVYRRQAISRIGGQKCK
jgi:hypothetical protein